MNDKTLIRFVKLFKGNDTQYGYFDPQKGHATINGKPPKKAWTRHLNGNIGIGIIPITKQSRCFFGVIDIDDHHKRDKPLTIAEWRKILKETQNLPLVACRSKSGGAHLYTFSKDSTTAREMRIRLFKWSQMLSFRSKEIYPKKDKVLESDPTSAWINLPYFGDQRYAINKKGKLELSEFLDRAESISKSVYKVAISDSEMPPCLTILVTSKISEFRNIALFNIGVFLKKKYPDRWEDKLFKINYKLCDPPLQHGEVGNILNMLRKKDYWYKCKEDPIQKLCDPIECKKCKYGIDTMDTQEFMLGPLHKIQTDPPRWVIEVKGKKIECATEDLFDYRRMRMLCMDRLTIVLPLIKNESWLNMIREKSETVVLVDAPEDASPKGQIFCALEDFIKTAAPTESKSSLMFAPIIVKEDGKKMIMFRSSIFATFLRHQKIQIPKISDLWTILRNICRHKKVRSGAKVIQVWYLEVPEGGLDTIKIEPKEPENPF